MTKMPALCHISTALAYVALSATPAGAQQATELAPLRAELQALREQQAIITRRIDQIETAMVTLESGAKSSSSAATLTQPQPPSSATEPTPKPDGMSRLVVSGDARIRYESNWGGALRNRDRMALRARLRANYKILDWLSVGGQIVTGDPDDPNSSDMTLGNFADDFQIALDQVWIKAQLGEGVEVVAGKFPQPFVRTDMVWEADVSPQGLGFGLRHDFGESAGFLANGIYFVIDESAGGPDSRMIGGQGVAWFKPVDELKLDIALGYYNFRLASLAGGDTGDFRSNRMLAGRYLSNYKLLDNIVVADWYGLGQRWPVKLTADLVHNFGAPRGMGDGIFLQAQAGRLVSESDWRLGYSYSNTDVDAVLAAFSEDNTALATNSIQHGVAFDWVLRSHLKLGINYYRYKAKEAAVGLGFFDGRWLDRLRVNFMVEF